MTVTDRFSVSALRFLAVLGALAVAFALLPQTASAQDSVDDPLDACPEDAPPADFTDRDEIPPVHRLNVDCAAHFDIVSGFGDNTYRPSLQVRRDQMATFIHGTLEAAGVDLPAGTSDTFTDVPDTNVHSAAINSLAEAGIVEGAPQGLGPNQYGPALRTRRDQMASFLMRAAGFAIHGDVDAFDSTDQAFTDVPSGNVHFEKVNAAAENNIALGVGNNLYAPDRETRRDQMASFVVRLLNFILDEDGVTPGPAVDLALDPAECVVGEPITVTATVTDADDAAIEGADVEFSAQLDDADPETTTAATDAEGAATATFTPENPGNLTFTVTTTVDGEEVTATQTVNCPEPDDEGVDTAAALTTEGPDLRSARITDDFDPLDGLAEEVVYCFDEPVVVSNTALFDLQNFDSDQQAQANNAFVSAEDNQCVVAQFPSGTYLPAYTLAVAEGQAGNPAVQDFAGNGNVLDSTALTNSPLSDFVGRTSGPDLVDVEVRSSTNEVDFFFDEAVQSSTNDPIGFHLYDSAGNRSSAVGSVISVNRVRTQWPGGVDVDNGVRFGVDFDTVADITASADPNPEGVVGDDTARPDLIDVTQGPSKSEFVFEFDEDVTLATAGDWDEFHVYADDATRLSGVSGTQIDARTFRVDFPVPAGFGDFPNEAITVATVEEQTIPNPPDATADPAVQSTGAPGETNTIGAIPIAQTNQGPGFTDGPDLVDVVFDAAAERATFIFDEDVQENLATTSAQDFLMVNGAGTAFPGTAIVDIDGNEVVVDFAAGEVSNAVGGLVDNSASVGPGAGLDAVLDEFGNANSPNAAGGGPAA